MIFNRLLVILFSLLLSLYASEKQFITTIASEKTEQEAMNRSLKLASYQLLDEYNIPSDSRLREYITTFNLYKKFIHNSTLIGKKIDTQSYIVKVRYEVHKADFEIFMIEYLKSLMQSNRHINLIGNNYDLHKLFEQYDIPVENSKVDLVIKDNLHVNKSMDELLHIPIISIGGNIKIISNNQLTKTLVVQNEMASIKEKDINSRLIHQIFIQQLIPNIISILEARK